MGIRLGDRRFRGVGRDRSLQNRSNGCGRRARPIPENVEKMLASGAETFYKNENGNRSYYDLVDGEYKPVPDRPGVLVLKSVKERTGVIKTNPGASLIDIGDGVACLEFHSKMNSIGGDTVQMMNFALDEVEKNFVGPCRRKSGREFFRRGEHHDAAARGAGRRVGRHQHDGPRHCSRR